MAKQKQNINRKSQERIKILCNELRITQKQLSEMSGVSENTLSKIATGKGPLTRQVAELIVEVCPIYRVEWLLGFDDAPHNATALNDPENESAKKILAAISFLNELNISVGQVNGNGVFLPAVKTSGFTFENKAIEIRYGGAIIWKGSMQEIECTLLEICDFSTFKINLLQRRRRENKWLTSNPGGISPVN